MTTDQLRDTLASAQRSLDAARAAHAVAAGALAALAQAGNEHAARDLARARARVDHLDDYVAYLTHQLAALEGGVEATSYPQWLTETIEAVPDETALRAALEDLVALGVARRAGEGYVIAAPHGDDDATH